MDSSDPKREGSRADEPAPERSASTIARLERRVRRAYEVGRIRRAAVGFVPALVVPGVVCSLEGLSLTTALLGAGLFALGVLALWRGQAAARGVLPGVATGVIPFAAALCAPHLHLCAGGQCLSACVPICATAGLAAGLAIGMFARKRGADIAFLGSASALALITGSLGCACVGLAGVLGMGAGFALGLAPTLLRKANGDAGA